MSTPSFIMQVVGIKAMALQEKADAKPGWGGPLTFNFIVESLIQTVELCIRSRHVCCVWRPLFAGQQGSDECCRSRSTHLAALCSPAHAPARHHLCVHVWLSQMFCLHHLGFPCLHLRREPGVFPLWMKLMRKESRETGCSFTDYL